MIRFSLSWTAWINKRPSHFSSELNWPIEKLSGQLLVVCTTASLLFAGVEGIRNPSAAVCLHFIHTQEMHIVCHAHLP